MRQSRERRIVAAALRCYPARWLSRHGEEATLLATELLEDGTPWWSIVGSLLGGAARERALKKPSLRVGSAFAAIATGIAAVPLALFASLTPASASSANVTLTITKPGDAARQLKASAAAHHVKIAIAERQVAANLVGSIVSVTPPALQRAPLVLSASSMVNATLVVLAVSMGWCFHPTTRGTRE